MRDAWPTRNFEKAKNQAFSDVVYEMYDHEDKNVLLKSSEIQQEDDGSLNFSNLVSDFKISNTENGKISADKTYTKNESAKQCKFVGNVKLTTDSGLKMQTEISFVDFDKQTAEGESHVTVIQDDIKLEANKYHFDLLNRIFVLTDQAQGNVKQDSIVADKIIIELQKTAAKSPKRIEAIGNAVYKSANYTLSAKKSINYTPENVDAYQNAKLMYRGNKKTYDITADHISGKLKNEKIASAKMIGHVAIKSKDAIIRGNYGSFRGNILTVSENVSIVNARGKILCEKAEINTITNDMKILNSRGMISKGNTSDGK